MSGGGGEPVSSPKKYSIKRSCWGGGDIKGDFQAGEMLRAKKIVFGEGNYGGLCWIPLRGQARWCGPLDKNSCFNRKVAIEV